MRDLLEPGPETCAERGPSGAGSRHASVAGSRPPPSGFPRVLAEVAAHRDDAEAAAVHYREALALASELGVRPLVAHCLLGLGKLYRRTSKRQEAQERLTTATTIYREMDMRYWLEQTEAQMADL